MIFINQRHFSKKSIKNTRKRIKEAATPKGNENSQESQNYFTPEFFLSGESRRPNRFFRLASRSPFSLLLYSLLHPNFRCTRLQFFATSWPALRAESTSGSVFSSLNRGIYIYMHVHEYRSKYKEREKKNKKKMKKKKDREKRFHPRKFLP